MKSKRSDLVLSIFKPDIPTMPIYMDVHEVPGAEALDLAEAHRKDVLIQDKYACKCITYWLDEAKGAAFCLIDAPEKSVVEQMHKHSHGFVPHKIIEVNKDVISSFLGRIRDPDDVEVSKNGLKLIRDSAFRVLLIMETTDPVLLHHSLGLQQGNSLLKKLGETIRKELPSYQGSEVEHTGHGFIISFVSVINAISCAMAIQKNLQSPEFRIAGLRMGMHAGNPVSKSDKVFGDTILLARQLATLKIRKGQVIISSIVKELLKNDHFPKGRNQVISLLPQDEIFLESLFSSLEKNWQNPDFTITEFCQSMSMSKSQLYRRTISLWGLSPNLVLKEFRLNKARGLLKKQHNNVSEITFDSGFNSPSYFTKCFKKHFGLTPAAYLNLL